MHVEVRIHVLNEVKVAHCEVRRMAWERHEEGGSMPNCRVKWSGARTAHCEVRRMAWERHEEEMAEWNEDEL